MSVGIQYVLFEWHGFIWQGVFFFFTKVWWLVFWPSQPSVCTHPAFLACPAVDGPPFRSPPRASVFAHATQWKSWWQTSKKCSSADHSRFRIALVWCNFDEKINQINQSLVRAANIFGGELGCSKTLPLMMWLLISIWGYFQSKTNELFYLIFTWYNAGWKIVKKRERFGLGGGIAFVAAHWAAPIAFF